MITEDERMLLQQWADAQMGEPTAEVFMKSRRLPYGQGRLSPSVHRQSIPATVTEDERKLLQQWADAHMDEETAKGLMHSCGLSYWS